MKDYSTPAEGILKREADGTIASQEVTEVELVNLAAVATSGSYNDLTDKPTIPTADKPTFYVSIEESQGGTLTVNKTPEEIYTAYSDGYVVYAIYKNQSLEFLLSLKLALPHITEFSGIYGVTESAVGFITVSNAGSGWTKQLSSVPISDKVVPTTRTINTKPLSSDVTLTAADVKAVGLTGDQTITGDKEFKGNIAFDNTDDGIETEVYFINNATFQHTSTVNFTGARVFFDGSATVDFADATVSGLPGLLPTVGVPDNGQFLRVVNGAWAAATVENANGVSF